MSASRFPCISLPHLFACLLELSADDKLIENQIDLVKVEDEVELADILKILVQDLHEEMDGLECDELIVRHVAADCEKQTRVATIDELVGAKLRCEQAGDEQDYRGLRRGSELQSAVGAARL